MFPVHLQCVHDCTYTGKPRIKMDIKHPLCSKESLTMPAYSEEAGIRPPISPNHHNLAAAIKMQYSKYIKKYLINNMKKIGFSKYFPVSYRVVRP